MRALFVITLFAGLVLPAGCASISPPIDISAEDLQTLHTQANQGVPDAQVNLGVLYIGGKGVPRDYKKAAQWFEKAAVQGNAEAQLFLGVLYHNGQGMPQNDAQAYMWYSHAANNSTGDLQKSAEDNRDEVARRMTPAQIAEAQKLAREWKSKGQ